MNAPKEVTITGNMGMAAAMKDGRLVTSYTEPDPELVAKGEAKADMEMVRPDRWAYLRTSSDGGRTWTAPQKAFTYPAGKGVVSGGNLLLVDHDGAIHCFNLRFFSFGDYSGRDRSRSFHCILLHNVSKDGGATWSAPQPVDFGARYTGALNIALQMDNGRILVPLSYFDPQQWARGSVARVVYSDDGGATWHRSNDCPVVHGGNEFIESGALEPVAVQFRSGMVWMVIRTTTGYFWESFSNDGATWTPARQTRIVSSNSPAGVLRLADGRLALFWNNLYGEPFDAKSPLRVSYARHILHGAISADEGQTWSTPKAIVQRRSGEPPNTQTTYPLACQTLDGTLVLSYIRTMGWDPNRTAVEIVHIDPDWLASP